MDDRELIRKAKAFHTKKYLGQNFLVDQDKLLKIVSALNPQANDQILEIGPGIGFLTQNLANSLAHVTAVELDQSCLSPLKELKLPNLQIVHDDFLQFDINRLVKALKQGEKLKVVGNVPYQITAKIIARLFGEFDKPSPWLPYIDQVVLTVQLEVAKRFIAHPSTKDYSPITLLTQYYTYPHIVDVLPALCFHPVPKVDSAIVSFTPYSEPQVAISDKKLFKQIIQAGFRQRRKMFKNTMSFLDLTEQGLQNIFQSLKLDPQARAENLSLQQFASISNLVYQLRKSSLGAISHA